MAIARRMSSIPYLLAFVACMFLILPFGLYIVYGTFYSYELVIDSIEEDFDDYLNWTLKRQQATLEDFFSYRYTVALKSVYSTLSDNLDTSYDLINELFTTLPHEQISSVLGKSTFPFPLYIIDQHRNLIATSKGFLPKHRQFLSSYASNMLDPIPPEIVNPKHEDGTVASPFLFLEKHLHPHEFRVGTLIPGTEVKRLLRKDIISFLRHYDNPDSYNFLLQPDGYYVFNESRLFPGRRIAAESDQQKANEITKKLSNYSA